MHYVYWNFISLYTEQEIVPTIRFIFVQIYGYTIFVFVTVNVHSKNLNQIFFGMD